MSQRREDYRKRFSSSTFVFRLYKIVPECWSTCSKLKIKILIVSHSCHSTITPDISWIGRLIMLEVVVYSVERGIGRNYACALLSFNRYKIPLDGNAKTSTAYIANTVHSRCSTFASEFQVNFKHIRCNKFRTSNQKCTADVQLWSHPVEKSHATSVAIIHTWNWMQISVRVLF